MVGHRRASGADEGAMFTPSGMVRPGADEGCRCARDRRNFDAVGRRFANGGLCCRVARDAQHTPFGGLQVILVGDFFQLPPVSMKRWRFAFEAPAWDELDPAICYLHEQHRQNDPEFQALLSLIRSDECSRYHPALSFRHVRHDRLSRDIPLLLTKNELVDRFNAAQLEDLPGAPETYRMTSDGGPQHVSALIKGCQSPEALS